MRKLLNNPKVVAVLALVAMVWVGVSLFPPHTDTVASAPEAEETEPEIIAPTVANGSSEAARRAALQSLALIEHPRDPFSERAKSVDEAAALAAKTPEPDRVETVRLSAIWTQGNATYVLINGRICQAGDRLARLTIESATQDGVWITHGEKRDFLSLGVDFTLVTPAHPGLSARSATAL
jgi:hypothetical protein